MDINNELIQKWEPKIQRMVSNIFILGMDKDDIAQELRIAIMKAAKSFDGSRGAIFHTYLHRAMINTIRTLITRVQKQPETRSFDSTYHETNLISSDLLKALKDPKDYQLDIEVENFLETENLSEKERDFIDLRREGLTMEEITDNLKACKECIFCIGYFIYKEGQKMFIERDYKNCTHKNGESAYKVRQVLREKFA